MTKEMRQIKFTIEADIVSRFKARCASEGVSMASVIRQLMANHKPTKSKETKIDTRPQRRKAVKVYIGLLEDVFENESQYRDSIPEQFEQRIEDADHSCEILEQAINLLEETY